MWNKLRVCLVSYPCQRARMGKPSTKATFTLCNKQSYLRINTVMTSIAKCQLSDSLLPRDCVIRNLLNAFLFYWNRVKDFVDWLGFVVPEFDCKFKSSSKNITSEAYLWASSVNRVTVNCQTLTRWSGFFCWRVRTKTGSFSPLVIVSRKSRQLTSSRL